MQKTTVLSAAVLAGMLSAAPVMADQQRPETDDINDVPAGNYMIDPLHSKITWGVDHYGFTRYEGQFVDLSGSLRLGEDAADSNLNIEIPLDKVLTGSGLTEHLQGEDFFNSEEYGTATFTSTSIEIDGDDEATITGDLALNGQTHPVEIDAEFNRGAVYPFDEKYHIGFSGETTIKRSDYAIDYLMPTDDEQGISDEVTLRIEAEFVPEQDQ
ncbi:YceI family protein [Kushneria indalinina]|uniref:Polyisoprenoid-binding protein YceI n=1 Tax=Kushneria indalinina DSM 14324 TaxID=1122140 RepID=A0A3D9DTR2_9GAMM|nr:YceI family protein [Kushneria indalinina]REC94170.1 polyisoprenoid-binding protein YceI [Kushneria indalinina DSM 14324]